MRINRYTIVCSIFFAALGLYGYSLANRAISGPIERCLDMEIFYQKATCINKILLSTDRSRLKEELFGLLMHYWINRDGAMGYTLSDIFLEIVEDNPDFFFSQVSRYEKRFDEWLVELDVLSFFWDGNPPSPLPEKKARIVNLLKNFRPSNKQVEVLKERLLNKLESIVPTQLD